jgi:hypothetical protein
MASSSSIRDSRLIDALDQLPRVTFEGTVWRVAREGRDPTQFGRSGGRWDDTTFDVLYTSLERDGAIAEIYYHLLRGQPVFPSKVRFTLHELKVSLGEAIRFERVSELSSFGLDEARYGQLSYNERTKEYPRSQEIAEVAFFLDSDGLIVPNARHACLNLVAFGDRLKPGAIERVKDHGLINWSDWAKR